MHGHFAKKVVQFFFERSRLCIQIVSKIDSISMALSYYSNWEALQHLNSDMNCSFAQTQSQLSPELLGFNDDFLLADTFIEPLFEPNDSFYPENYSTLILDPLNTLKPEPFLLQEFESYNHYKRLKSYNYQDYYPEYQHGLFCGYIPNPSMIQDFSPEVMMPPLPDFPTPPPVYSSGSSESIVKKPNGGSLSAQSIAARQRRRKITEKTQELGKLIPGGQKMNTAEMFQAAYKYIKYLQAQVGVLEFMGLYQETAGEQFLSEELHGLLESPLIEEKLYSTEKCLVPKKFVEALANDHEIQPRLQVLKELKQLT
ncbi:transcription factor bHLH [Forsythia ovata]|uniref:Transcription factor bHLH n=1 Tax=Forsythia ovata TaxID=205694 RepID=A0ABD1QE43_9LAMI